MSNIIFIGDLHLTGISPASRKETNEQYREVLLNKLDSVLKICLNRDVKTVIILGDVFNNNSGISNLFETELWGKFLEFKKNNIDVYTIIGNHDMIFQNDNEFKGTYLYKAFLADIIKHLDCIQLDDVVIKGFDYLSDYTATENKNNYSICVAHSFYENELFGGVGNANLTKPKCEILGYNAYVLGHDHTPYADVEESFKVIRPGSLTRGSSKTCNLFRKVNIVLFNTETKIFEKIEVPVSSGSDVFYDKVVLSKQIDMSLDKLLENFQASKGMSVYDIIKEHKNKGLETLGNDYEFVEKIIRNYLEANGIFEKGDSDDYKE